MKIEKQPTIFTKVGIEYGKEERRNEKEPCAIPHDACIVDGVGGAVVDKLFTQNHRRALSSRAVGFSWRADRGKGIAHL